MLLTICLLNARADAIFLIGARVRNKRRFLTQTLYKEAAGHFVDAAMLKTHFPEIDIAYLQTTMHDIFMKYNCYINNFRVYQPAFTYHGYS